MTACSGGRIVSWIIYCWLVWCERKTLFPAENLRSFTSERTGCEKLRQDGDILGGENSLSLDIRSPALDMLADAMDVYVLKRARIDGFCYRIHFDPASADKLTWYDIYILIGVFHYVCEKCL